MINATNMISCQFRVFIFIHLFFRAFSFVFFIVVAAADAVVSSCCCCCRCFFIVVIYCFWLFLLILLYDRHFSFEHFSFHILFITIIILTLFDLSFCECELWLLLFGSPSFVCLHVLRVQSFVSFSFFFAVSKLSSETHTMKWKGGKNDIYEL